MWSAIAAIVSLIVTVLGWFGYGRYSKDRKEIQEAVKANEARNRIMSYNRSQLIEWMRKNGLVRKPDNGKS